MKNPWTLGSTMRLVGFVDEAAPYAVQIMSMGLLPGQVFTVRRIAPLGDPIEITAGTLTLCLRKREMQALRLEPVL